jgi:quercetin dioxygenase-like cupin family protein
MKRRPSRRFAALFGFVLVVGCRSSVPPAHDPHPDSAFAATTGVQRAESGALGPGGTLVPLRPFPGDAEIVAGDPEKPGEPFVMRIHELPGAAIPPHVHPVDENLTVVQGVLYFAVGETWDRAALRELKVGDFAFVPRGSTMFGYCPDGAVVQVHGIGPFQIHWRHGLKTLDSPDAASTFSFRRGDRVRSARGVGTIREGYASGPIVQYEIEPSSGNRFMADQQDVRLE